MRRYAILLICLFIILLTLTGIGVVLLPKYEEMFFSIRHFFFIIGGVYASHISVFYVIKDNNGEIFTCKSKQSNEDNKRMTYMQSMSVDGVHPSEVSTDVDSSFKINNFIDFFNDEIDRETGYNRLQNEFDAFLRHCLSELTTENILYWINVVLLWQFIVEN